MLRHVVSWKLTGSVVAEVDEQVEHIARDLESLAGRIPEVISIKVVRNVVNPGQNFDAAVIADFEDADALQAYIRHPDHVEASAFLKSVTAQRACVDYLV
ncbi:MAG TPA: Dabb family protein [Homoserinimonas sp.]|nr:Dabb family protein [Homoserinimonas sp.]